MRRGQVWIETVLYTLIGLSLIGLVLAFVMPKINESKDRALVEQSINSLNLIDEKINSVLQAPGNVRIIDFNLKRGEIFFEPDKDTIVMSIDGLVKPYSEENVTVNFGNIGVLSQKRDGRNVVNIYLNYSKKINLLYSDKEEGIKFSPASTPYRFSLKSLPVQDGMERVSVEEISGR